MFVIKLLSRFRAKSLALTRDSLDMLDDAFVYRSIIFVIYKSQHAQAGVSLLKGFIMFGFTFIVLIKVYINYITGQYFYIKQYLALELSP